MTSSVPSTSERIQIVIEHALRVFGDKEHVNTWMRSENVFLERQAPCELIETEEGFEAVETYLSRVEYGVYT